MSRMLSTEDLIELLEENTNSPAYNTCGIGVGIDIEGTDFRELIIWVYNKQDLNPLKVLTADILNVISVEYTGYPQASAVHHHRI